MVNLSLVVGMAMDRERDTRASVLLVMRKLVSRVKLSDGVGTRDPEMGH
jgi:hypothetical protein